MSRGGRGMDEEDLGLRTKDLGQYSFLFGGLWLRM